MTLEQNKKVTLALIEEYSSANQALTDDEDIASRLNLVYSTAYQELSQNKKILKSKTMKEIEDETSEGYEEYTLPSTMYQLKKVIALDENNIPKQASYYIVDDKMYIDKSTDYKYVIEYYEYPTVITEDTDGDFELEIDQDAQLILPYQVANDILKTDPSANYAAFYTEYQRKLQALDSRKELVSVMVEEGVL